MTPFTILLPMLLNVLIRLSAVVGREFSREPSRLVPIFVSRWIIGCSPGELDSSPSMKLRKDSIYPLRFFNSVMTLDVSWGTRAAIRSTRSATTRIMVMATLRICARDLLFMPAKNFRSNRLASGFRI